MPAAVAELVDAHDSKSCELAHVGSIPTSGTIYAVQKSFFQYNAYIASPHRGGHSVVVTQEIVVLLSWVQSPLVTPLRVCFFIIEKSV